VIWDRRVRDRRQKITQVSRNRHRGLDRRQPGSISWVTLGMVLVVARPRWDAAEGIRAQEA